MLVTDVSNGPLVSSSEPLTRPEALAGQASALGSAAGFLTGENQRKPWSVPQLMQSTPTSPPPLPAHRCSERSEETLSFNGQGQQRTFTVLPQHCVNYPAPCCHFSSQKPLSSCHATEDPISPLCGHAAAPSWWARNTKYQDNW